MPALPDVVRVSKMATNFRKLIPGDGGVRLQGQLCLGL